MSLQRIAKQLRREVQSNPGKAAVLGLLLLVGLYAWTPLVIEWFGSPQSKTFVAKSKTTPHPPSDQTGQTGSTLAATTPIVTEKKDKTRWPEVIESIAQDQRMTSARYLSAMRNPFVLSPEERAMMEKARQEEATLEKNTATHTDRPADNQEEEQQTPSDLGIVLTGTIIGPRHRVALFDDQVIPEGSILTVRQDGRSSSDRQQAEAQASPIVFFVQEVQANSVRLRRKGKEYQLQLPGNPIADRLAEINADRQAPTGSNSDR